MLQAREPSLKVRLTHYFASHAGDLPWSFRPSFQTSETKQITRPPLTDNIYGGRLNYALSLRTENSLICRGQGMYSTVRRYAVVHFPPRIQSARSTSRADHRLPASAPSALHCSTKLMYLA